MSNALSTISEMLDQYGDFKSSDIQLTSNRGAYYVKDKATRKIKNFPFKGDELIQSLIDNVIVGGMAKINEHGQADASFDQGGSYRGRLTIRKELGGLSGTMRIISRDIPTTKQLGLPSPVVNLIGRPSGLVLLVGQTGSGKSTTIAALNNLVNMTQETSIYTLEAPIEYVYPEGKSLVVQREIGVHVGSFAEGVENAKRSHPRIIVVGEILNTATARSALLAASSGHLVVSTMHAGTAAEAVDSFVSMFTPEEQGLVRTQLAQSLLGIVAQNLIAKPGGGMALAQEIAFNTPTFAELLRGSGNRSNDTKYIQQLLLSTAGKADGMISMEEALATLVRKEEITLESGYSTARDRHAFEEKLTLVGVRVPSAA
ncbi:type IV pilus twitching motility protein PilT [Cryobacterium zhongshanensis]|uniref:Flp pilus assembly complex ATPase component TadA n=1 Tax=Cryobacterium zhongshanensis TaxID=2928153 RepID=A0AA41QZN7_9MICO|nr:ATPase, T2SS/T4P/T4SS family [Cryobacterium zhongshanensis]MCI4659779.1 Flp pilus assembly complex ATPase component TadA [Cryobacterium zhongshanensis]